MDCVENTASQLLHCCILQTCCSHYLAAAVVQLLLLWSLSSNGSACHIAPSLRHTAIYFLRAVVMTFVIGLTLFSHGSVNMVITLQLLLLLPP
jgi:hypothetical protein